ncbi:MAG: proline--tRNA ligase [Planctomycetota bacterium]|nr:proline--tRNA ligase [Planctomycetota bacterium]
MTPRARDYAQWYQDVVRCADLAEPAEVVRGCMVIKPHGYAIWEKIQAELDRRFKALGHKNAYFPLFIPESFIRKEAEHVEGFSPELAVVTIGGGKELTERLIVRPTSETIIGHFFSKWISSYRDLPLRINQWANVVRWEMRPRVFLRTTEFLWQEGHTAHATHEEAIEETLRMLEVYESFAREFMAMPVIAGQKTPSEKFAGALTSYTIEAMMQDGRALQAGTSHDLGQNFGKAFDVKYLSREGRLEYVWQTSWGVSTRLIGALIMCHSDDNGLVLPPKLAPIHTAIVPIYKSDAERTSVLEACNRLGGALRNKGLSVVVDDRDECKPGAKFFEWERKGVPARVEIGPKDLARGQVAIKRRDGGDRFFVSGDAAADRIVALMDEIQDALRKRALEFRESHTRTCDSFDEFVGIMAGPEGFVRGGWCGDASCEAKVRETTRATIRCIPLNNPKESCPCMVCGKPAGERVIYAKAY